MKMIAILLFLFATFTYSQVVLSPQEALNALNGKMSVTSDGYIDVHAGDVHYQVINRTFANYTGTTSTIGSAVSPEDYQITVASDAAFSVGDYISITEGVTQEAVFPRIIAKPGANVLTLDREITRSYSTSATVEIVEPEIATANGSISSEVIYKIQPPSDETWHITRVILSAYDNGTLSDNKFISATALTNGITMVVNGDTERVLTNWKSNRDMVLDTFDTNYDSASGGGTDNGVRVRWTFKNSGAVVNLNGANGDTLELHVRDNISALSITSIKMRAQGHVED